ncbi:hypothetical protein M514_24201 [Trichuris suis]|uniref:Uncharacterized protein n=1 Tax=Trichuris suis TaxID=68888 RepID=A0A085N2H3_9BILA|nr:hypothetical protein M514_24201 [Trichuris suis]
MGDTPFLILPYGRGACRRESIGSNIDYLTKHLSTIGGGESTKVYELAMRNFRDLPAPVFSTMPNGVRLKNEGIIGSNIDYLTKHLSTIGGGESTKVYELAMRNFRDLPAPVFSTMPNGVRLKNEGIIGSNIDYLTKHLSTIGGGESTKVYELAMRNFRDLPAPVFSTMPNGVRLKNEGIIGSNIDYLTKHLSTIGGGESTKVYELAMILSTNTEREKAVKGQEMKTNHPITKHPSFNPHKLDH